MFQADYELYQRDIKLSKYSNFNPTNSHDLNSETVIQIPTVPD